MLDICTVNDFQYVLKPNRYPFGVHQIQHINQFNSINNSNNSMNIGNIGNIGNAPNGNAPNGNAPNVHDIFDMLRRVYGDCHSIERNLLDWFGLEA